jgi:aminoglycoside phosphotransferase
MAMAPVTHKWKAHPSAPAVHGFIAQDMQALVPEAVSGDPDSDEMMSMDYGRITPVLVAALQDAHKKIEALEERLAEMEAM